MSIAKDIDGYLSSLPAPRQAELSALHQRIRKAYPKAKQWFSDGRNSEGKVVSNPSIGYGSLILQYADGSAKETFQVGISANTSGISVYVMGVTDKSLLDHQFGKRIGKATLTGYCIKFKKLSEVNAEVLNEAVALGMELRER